MVLGAKVLVTRVDFVRGTVEVAENLILDNGRPEFGPLKTKASRRKVPLPAKPWPRSKTMSSSSLSAATT